MCVRILRIKLVGLSDICCRLVMCARVFVCGGAFGIGVYELGIELDRLREIGDCTRVIPFVHLGETPAEKATGKSRLKPDCRTEIGNGTI